MLWCDKRYCKWKLKCWSHVVSGCCTGADGRGKGDEGKRLKVVLVAKLCWWMTEKSEKTKTRWWSASPVQKLQKRVAVTSVKAVMWVVVDVV